MRNVNRYTIMVAVVSVAVAIMAIIFVYSSLNKSGMTEDRCLSNNGLIKTDNLGQRFCEFRTGAWIMLD